MKTSVVVLAALLVPEIAFSGGPGGGHHHHHPPISNSQFANMMPGYINSFNNSAALAAANLMDMSARTALQAQANALAAQYGGLQHDAQGGNYDTSNMGGMMSGFGKNVNDVQLPETRSVTPAPGLEGTPQSAGPVTNIENRSITINMQPIAPAESPAPPPASADPNLAGANEQIIPDLQSALNVPDARPAPAVRAPAGVGTPSAATGNGSTLPLIPVAASADSPKNEALFAEPSAAPAGPARGARRSATVSDPYHASDLAQASADGALPAASASSTAAPQELDGDGGQPGALDPGIVDYKAAKREGPVLPKNLVAAVRRVQGAEGEAPEKSGFLHGLKKALFGPRSPSQSSFFRPLDLPGEPMAAGVESSDSWWQPLLLPMFFTFFFSALVFWRHARQKRRTRRVASHAPREVELGTDGEPPSSPQSEPTTAVITLAAFRRPRRR